MGDGEAGPGAGGQRHPDQSVCGLMGSSPLSLGETSLVSVMLGDQGSSLHLSLALGQPSVPGGVSGACGLSVQQKAAAF